MNHQKLVCESNLLSTVGKSVDADVGVAIEVYVGLDEDTDINVDIDKNEVRGR